jgi:hypothetical protein
MAGRTAGKTYCQDQCGNIKCHFFHSRVLSI